MRCLLKQPKQLVSDRWVKGAIIPPPSLVQDGILRSHCCPSLAPSPGSPKIGYITKPLFSLFNPRNSETIIGILDPAQSHLW